MSAYSEGLRDFALDALAALVTSPHGRVRRYQPKPGDRVTSPILVGEWVVADADNLTTKVIDHHRDAVAYVLPEVLVPVAPPLPPEPAVGEVVWARGRYWQRDGTWFSPGSTSTTSATRLSWSDLAADAEPVVPVSTVLDWARNVKEWRTAADEIEAEFGWKP